jgi:hypothetical protein
MAVAFDISAEEAGSAMTGLRTNFKLNQDGVISLGDSFNYLANTMDAKAGDIINFANRASGVAGNYKFTGQQLGALGATFLAMKIPAEVGARASNTLMTKLGLAAEQGKDAQAAFQRLGFSGKEMSEAFKKDAQGALVMFLEQVKKSSDPMRDLNAILGEGFSDEVAKLVSGLDVYKGALQKVGDQSAYSRIHGGGIRDPRRNHGQCAGAFEELRGAAGHHHRLRVAQTHRCPGFCDANRFGSGHQSGEFVSGAVRGDYDRCRRLCGRQAGRSGGKIRVDACA